MILLVGGAYQGKKMFAAKQWGLETDAFFYCSEESGEINFSKLAICGLHLHILWQVKNGVDPMKWVKAHLPQLKEKIILCDDIFCGVVPLDTELRAWREATGQVLLLLSNEADEAYRLFCGLADRLK